MAEIIECVPNFSEGRDLGIIKQITNAIESIDNIKLLDVDPGADTNRTVVTFIGTKESVIEGAFAGIKMASQIIDMRKHSGAHARMGATDVCPLIPVSGISIEECIELSHKLAKKVAKELNIPTYLYEKSAQKPERINLANIRQGEYEGLSEKFKDPEWKPDYGDAVFNEKSGATVVGVREFLIAYNINLNTQDKKKASDIALTMREKGRLKRDKKGKVVKDEKGKSLRQPGTLKYTKAVGWYIDEYKMAQISINLTNYNVTAPHQAFEEARRLANKKGLRVTGSELVGLIPLEAMLAAGKYYLKKQGKCEGVPETDIIRTAIQSLGLNEVSNFDPEKKIIEYQFKEFSNPLVDMTMAGFVDELSTDSPAPGGGSVAAYCGALCAGLTAMVGNLTHGKKGYERKNIMMNEYSSKAQEIKAKLIRLVDLDTAAFNKVMDCFRMKKKTDEQKKLRNYAIQEATKNATQVPLEIMKYSLEALKLTDKIIQHGNINSISDAGVAGLTGESAVKGAGYNVKINLAGIEDTAFCEKMKNEVEELNKEATRIGRRISRSVNKIISES